MSEELKPCPFCGATGLAVPSGPCAWNDGGNAWNVTCHTRNCHGGIFALGVDMFATPAEAIAAWNTRVDDRVSTPNPVDDRETRNMIDKLRDAVEVWREASKARGKAFYPFDGSVSKADGNQAAAAVIEQDRQATRAALVSEIVADLRVDAGLCDCFARFILPKPVDPLVAVMDDFMSMDGGCLEECVEQFRVALAKRGLEVREIEG